MSALLRLYPPAWRERYGDEFVALLQEHPLALADVFDLIRGALDAHLHPQVRGAAAAPDKESAVNQRLLAVMAAVGGIAWIVGVATALVLPPDMYGDPDTSLAVYGVAIGSSLIGIALGELGTRPGSRSWTGHAVAIAGIVLGLTVVMGWPWFTLGLVGFPLLVMLAAARGYQADLLPGWLVVLLAAASVASLLGVYGGGFLGLVALTGVAALVLAVVVFRAPARSVDGGLTEQPA